MNITINELEEKFFKFNKQYFNNILFKPAFKITRTKRTLGQCTTFHTLFGERYVISISKYYKRSDDEINNTLLHEMIHLYLSQRHIKDNGHHGAKWQAIAQRISKESGLCITAYSNRPSEVNNEIQKQPYNIFVLVDKRLSKPFIMRVCDNSITQYKKVLAKNYAQTLFFQTKDIRFDNLPNNRIHTKGLHLEQQDFYDILEKYKPQRVLN